MNKLLFEIAKRFENAGMATRTRKHNHVFITKEEFDALCRMIAPEGWKLVPVEPTEEMVIAGCRHENMGDMAGRYQAMLSVAPEPPSTKDVDC